VAVHIHFPERRPRHQPTLHAALVIIPPGRARPTVCYYTTTGQANATRVLAVSRQQGATHRSETSRAPSRKKSAASD
jgi:hypothetical protein